MSTFTTSDGLSLYYSDEGPGLPILCLAGLTRAGSDFDYVAPHLANHRVIRLDYRGRGRSDWDPNHLNYSLPIECRDVLELLGHLGLDAVAVIGTSRGGLNAMGLAATAPDRLLGVALNDIGPELDPDGLKGIMTYLGRNPAAKTYHDAAIALENSQVGFENVPKSRWLEEAHKHFSSDSGGLNITYDPKLRDAVEAGGEIPDLWPFFDAFAGKPLCAIRGAGSNLLSAKTLLKMESKRPDMISTTLKGRGHIPFLDEPEAIDTLNTWLEQLK